MIDPISAMAAVNAAVKMIKQVSGTVDNVASLGPLIGKYFDAKHTAVKSVREAKRAGGSNMGRAIEIEMALKAQRDFEEELKGLFFASNNMDIWNNIMKRVAEMNAEDALEARREKDRERNRKRRQQELNELFLGIVIIITCLIFAGWGLVEFINYCHSSRCGR